MPQSENIGSQTDQNDQTIRTLRDIVGANLFGSYILSFFVFQAILLIIQMILPGIFKDDKAYLHAFLLGLCFSFILSGICCILSDFLIANSKKLLESFTVKIARICLIMIIVVVTSAPQVIAFFQIAKAQVDLSSAARQSAQIAADRQRNDIESGRLNSQVNFNQAPNTSPRGEAAAPNQGNTNPSARDPFRPIIR